MTDIRVEGGACADCLKYHSADVNCDGSPMTEQSNVTEAMIDEAVGGLVELHRRLLGCFTSPTGEPPPRRPRLLEPKMKDCDAALDAAVVLERLKVAMTTAAPEKEIVGQRNIITLILDKNYHTAISKAQSTADEIITALETARKQG